MPLTLAALWRFFVSEGVVYWQGMKKCLVIANWKMYIKSPKEAESFASTLRGRSRQFSGVEVVVAPALPLIPATAAALKGSTIKIAGQSVSPFDGGAHTGGISASMLKEAGASMVIVGHSERRAEGESNEAINEQLLRVLAAGLIAVVCVGEAARDAAGVHFQTITNQLSSALKHVPKVSVSKIVVAYEPVWAINKQAADAMKPADLTEMVIFIRKTLADVLERSQALRVPVLYGGSVEGQNVRALLLESGVGGFLVGHASADVDSFVEILKSVRLGSR